MQDHARVDDGLFDQRDAAQEALHVRVVGKAHDALDARAVVPAAIEDHDFAGRGQMRNVALHVHLAASRAR